MKTIPLPQTQKPKAEGYYHNTEIERSVLGICTIEPTAFSTIYAPSPKNASTLTNTRKSSKP